MNRHWLWLACVWWLAGSQGGLLAQCAPPAWSSLNVVPGTNARVAALARWDPDGAGPAPALVVAGGGFSIAGGAAASRIASWDGTSWAALGSGMSPASAEVNCLAVFQGQLVAGGTFASAGGVAASNIARWDGSSWLPLGPGLDARVRALAVWNGALYAAGHFQFASGLPSAGIARWNGAAWQPLAPAGVPAGESVHALAVYNGELVAGGRFSAIGGVPVANIARWNGSAWSALGGGIAPGGILEPVRALEVYGSRLIAGGDFQSAGGVAASNIAAWDGMSWQPLGLGVNAQVSSLRAFGTTLVVGGFFGMAGGTSVRSLASWNGSSWAALVSGTSGGPLSTGAYPVDALLADGADLHAGGSFVSIGDILASNLARWNGISWSTLAPPALDGDVRALLPTSQGLVAGGLFAVSGGAPSFSVARWDGAWQRLGTGLPQVTSAITYGIVGALASFGGGIVAAGRFDLSAPGASDAFARWDGSTWSTLPPGGPLAGFSLEPHAGALVAAGMTVGSWNGSTWATLANIQAGPGERGVFAMRSAGAQLYAAGSFLAIGGVPASNIATWNGVSWSPLGGGRGAIVRALALYNGELIAGGDQDAAGSAIARWNGSAWLPLGGGVNGTVHALEVWNGELIAGGLFTQAGAATVSNIARWNGSSWSALGGGANGQVRVVRAHEGGIVAGGSFVSADGIVSPGVARWSSPLPVVRVTQPMGAGTPVAVADRGLVAGHEYFNIVSGDLCPGGPGTGPVGGLCFNDINALVAQLLVPVGAVPFHFVASAPAMSFGPYALASGLAFEVLCFDATGGVVGCIGPAMRFVVP